MKVNAVILGLAIAATAGQGAESGANTKEPTIQFEFGHARPAAPALEKFTLAQLNAAVLAETNRVRVEHGLPPLRWWAVLAAAAEDQAAFMALTLHVAHENPIRGQHDVLERVRRHGDPPFSRVAENVLSTGFAAPRDPPQSCAEVAIDMVARWLESPGHRANLLNRHFTDLGCATQRVDFVGGTQNIFAAQVFATRDSVR